MGDQQQVVHELYFFLVRKHLHELWKPPTAIVSVCITEWSFIISRLVGRKRLPVFRIEVLAQSESSLALHLYVGHLSPVARGSLLDDLFHFRHLARWNFRWLFAFFLLFWFDRRRNLILRNVFHIAPFDVNWSFDFRCQCWIMVCSDNFRCRLTLCCTLC